jgi:hypothetical protein
MKHDEGKVGDIVKVRVAVNGKRDQKGKIVEVVAWNSPPWLWAPTISYVVELGKSKTKRRFVSCELEIIS